MSVPIISPDPAEAARPESAPLIELRDITRTFRNGELAVQVLHGITLTIHPGEFVALVGASGSGKSTLMNILGCLDRPSGGQYQFMGRDVSSMSPDDLAQLRREAFGFVFQSYNLISTATALENVEVPAVYLGMPPEQRRRRAAELLETLGLGERLHHRPSQLSGGQQQRVSIARALMNGGRIILADEPTGALDSRSGREVLALLEDLAARGHTVILITHDREVAAHARRVIEISDGRVVADRRQPAAESSGAPEQAASPVPDAGAATRGSIISDAHEAVRTALRALRANFFRTVLTLLGIVIGVGSVIVMLAVGNGSSQAVLDRISAMGTNLLIVRPGAPNVRGRGDDIATLTPADAAAMAEVPNVIAAVPELEGRVTVRVDNFDVQTQATATGHDFPLARSWYPVEGTFFDADDVFDYATVAVLGRTVADNVFPGGGAVGEYVLINSVLFQVIGVMDTKGASVWGMDQDDVVFVPYTTGGMRLFGQHHLRAVTIAVDDVSLIDATQQEVSDLLAIRHGTEDFRIRNMASLIDTASETQDTLTRLLGSIAAISLLVGGIGVMNIMLVNVTERTREIGIRMAAGARQRNIMQQFLTEAMVVSAIGGAVGVIGGLATAAALQAFGTSIQFTTGPVLLAFGCAFATGLIFGYVPARKASRLDPVVALASD
ncbi:MAG: MacB family efflux pump subunit [Gammaproteobacteria bacterium]|jgi:macrolide transport system ATP-binding/permease protein|nr:MacB family efflux pump subunit [Gammaproteobacteria bacterium]